MNDMEPKTNLIPPGEVDREGAMAKADLYKLATYSVKLFKKIEDDTQLESWVQAKITKAADYIASVYHYLEYELEFSNFGSKLENSGIYNEEQKLELKNKLLEAKEKIAELKKIQASKLEEAKSPKAKKDWDKDGKIESEKDEVIGSRRKAAGLDEAWDDDDDDDDVRRADRELKKKGVKLPKVKADPDKDMSKLAKKSKKEDDLDETYGQGVYESWDDDDEDDDVKKADSELKKRGIKLPKVKDKEVPIKKTAKDKEEELDESSKPSAGLSAKKKSSTVKKAKAGGDIGKKGKGFKDVAAKAAKQYGSKEKGEKVAAAAMWKNIKRETMDEVSDEENDVISAPQPEPNPEENDIISAPMNEGVELDRIKQFLVRLNG